MINASEWRIDGPKRRKGQCVSMDSSLVTVTHLPSGTTATVDMFSQHMNRHVAMEMVEWALTYAATPQKETDT